MISAPWSAAYTTAFAKKLSVDEPLSPKPLIDIILAFGATPTIPMPLFATAAIVPAQ